MDNVSLLKKAQCDAIFVSSPENVAYLSGFFGEGYILVTGDTTFLFTDSRYTEYAESLDSGCEITDITGSSVYPHAENIIRRLNVHTLGFENNECSFSEYCSLSGFGVSLTGINDAVTDLRIVKSETELSYIRKAVGISDLTFEKILADIKPGVTEAEIAAKIGYYQMLLGASGNSFDTIVASGENGSKPHAVPGGRQISSNEFVTMDFGCVYCGYCSDMTRTVYVGSPSGEERQLYMTVLDAQMDVINGYRPGMTARDTDALARNHIKQCGYGEYFGHGTGHGVGLEIHEKPVVSPRCDDVIPEGTVFSVEPGIYIPGRMGIRIEDLVLTGNGGLEVLTVSDKKLMVL